MKRWLIWLLSISLSLLIIIVIAGKLLVPPGADTVYRKILASGIKTQKLRAPFRDSLLIGGYAFSLPTNQPLLLIHGSPGDWSAWENIISDDSISRNYYVIAVDRPGYGSTTIPPMADLRDQALAITALLTEMELSNIVLVGHSYGGAVAMQLLADNPALFELAIIVAPTISPVHMAPRWYNDLAAWPLINNMLPKDLIASNREMVGLPASLLQLESSLKEISRPVIYIQGTKDVLVPFASIDYFSEKKPSGVDYIVLEDENHFILWTNPKVINDKLNELINENEN